MKTRHFRELQVWQRGMVLAQSVYTLTRDFPQEERFGLTIQLRRAAVSIPSNIAEGHGRGSDTAFAHFLRVAKGSLFEMQTQLQLSANLGLVKPEPVDALLHETEELAKMLNGLLRTITVDTKPLTAS
ncbi:four helix bundle protein [Silvibacterium acidisoli]|uniref:four helix bundle protein n=1 Tax=Acidobacteriaceae bacterium ZG23-2 TaxID=2883246 RepID=UPI00406CCDE6